jgi:hypothetical protein
MVPELLALLIVHELMPETLLEQAKLAKPGDFFGGGAYSWGAGHWSSSLLWSGARGCVWRPPRAFSFRHPHSSRRVLIVNDSDSINTKNMLY